MLQLANDLPQRFHLLTGYAVLLHLRLDVAYRIHDGRVIPVELLPDVPVRDVEQLSTQVDGGLSRVGDVTRSFLAHDIGMADLEEVLRHLQDIVCGEPFAGTA